MAEGKKITEERSSSNQQKHLDKKSLQKVADKEQKLEELLLNLRNAEKVSEFFQYVCILHGVVRDLDDKERKLLVEKTNSYIDILGFTIAHPIFESALFKTLKEHEKLHQKSQYRNLKHDKKREIKHKICTEDKKLIKQVIEVAFFLANSFHDILTKDNIFYFRKSLIHALRNLSFIKEDKFSINKTCFLLEEVVLDHAYDYNEDFPFNIDADPFFNQVKNTCAIAATSFVSLTILHSLKNKFYETKDKLKDDDFNLQFAFNDLYNFIYRVDEARLTHYSNVGGVEEGQVKKFRQSFRTENEKNVLYFVKQIVKKFYREGNFFEMVHAKIDHAGELKEKVVTYAQQNLEVFSGEKNKGTWSNKIFLNTIKTLAVLDVVKFSDDKEWRVNVAIYEFAEWIREIHAILNKFDIEDDWNKLEEHLHQEDVNNEWKSSFLLPFQDEYKNEKAEEDMKKRVLSKISKTILGMINAQGGVILVGVVENPDMISRSEIKKHIIQKHNLTFFDVTYEFEKYGQTIDSIKLSIQEWLKNTTQKSVDVFNGLFNIRSLQIKSEGGDEEARVYKIVVEKSDKPIFNVETKGETNWISLTRRANARTVMIDPREYLSD